MLASSPDSPFGKCSGFKDEMTEQDPFGEAGNPCTICSSETRFNTHFGFPCQHAACELCWQTWLRERPTCMICGNVVKSVHKFSESMLLSSTLAGSGDGQGGTHPASSPPGASDRAGMSALNMELEAALAQLVKELVLVKARLREVDPATRLRA